MVMLSTACVQQWKYKQSKKKKKKKNTRVNQGGCTRGCRGDMLEWDDISFPRYSDLGVKMS